MRQWENLGIAILRQSVSDMLTDCEKVKRNDQYNECWNAKLDAEKFIYSSIWFEDLCRLLAFDPQEVRWAVEQKQREKENG